MVGSPAEVADRLSRAAELLTADTHLLSLNTGGCRTEEFIDMVELIGAMIEYAKKNGWVSADEKLVTAHIADAP